MGLKESGLRGSLRNVSVGIAAIPDAYLSDDWGDNKLQDRDDGGTTTYNGVEGVHRPEWEQDGSNDLPSASDEKLNLRRDEYAITEINLNFDETITWVAENVDYRGDDNQTGWTLFAETDDMETGDNSFPGALVNGYYVMFREDSVLLYRYDGPTGSPEFSLLASDDSVSFPVDVTVTREPNGTWEMLLDGSSVGTDDDDTYTTDEFTAVGARDDGSPDTDIEEIKVT